MAFPCQNSQFLSMRICENALNLFCFLCLSPFKSRVVVETIGHIVSCPWFFSLPSVFKAPFDKNVGTEMCRAPGSKESQFVPGGRSTEDVCKIHLRKNPMHLGSRPID